MKTEHGTATKINYVSKRHVIKLHRVLLSDTLRDTENTPTNEQHLKELLNTKKYGIYWSVTEQTQTNKQTTGTTNTKPP